MEESLTKAEKKDVEDSFFSKENDSNRERVRLGEFHFSWLEISVIEIAKAALISLFFNHLNRNLS